MFAVLPAGLAKRHHANQAACLRVQNVCALPVLLSGIAALSLTAPELQALDCHYKKTLQSLMKLPDKCPAPVIYFLAGTAPITAHIHRRQLGLFGMICRLPNNILHKVASSILASEPDTSKSWFVHIRQLCLLYSLPSPLLLLQQPPSKYSFKSLINKRVLDLWQRNLRDEAQPKISLTYFNPSFMSLCTPHPVWTPSSTNAFETNKTRLQTSLLSGRYKSDYLSRHWVKENPDGLCVLCPGKHLLGTIEHLLVSCDTLFSTRQNITQYWFRFSSEDDALRKLLTAKLAANTTELVQFLLDPSVVPEVISGCQRQLYNLDELYKLTRCWCYAVHRKRLQITGKLHKFKI